MKLSKILLGSAVLAALSFGFMGCAEEDDPYEMIEENNSTTWSINHTNEDANTVHRGYKSTNFKHAGGLVNIHFNNSLTSTPDGVMGIIFGMHDNAENKKAVDFYVVGVRNKSSKGDYYISKYSKVTNLQGNNFGVADGDGASEVEVKPLGTTTGLSSAVIDTSDGYSLGVYFRDVVVDTTADATTGTFTHKYQIYFVKIDSTKTYDVDDDTGDLYVGGKAKAAGATVVDLGDAVAEIEYESDSDSLSQYKFAPYANVYPNSAKCTADYQGSKGTGTVTGKWTIPADYKHADVVADF